MHPVNSKLVERTENECRVDQPIQRQPRKYRAHWRSGSGLGTVTEDISWIRNQRLLKDNSADEDSGKRRALTLARKLLDEARTILDEG